MTTFNKAPLLPVVVTALALSIFSPATAAPGGGGADITAPTPAPVCCSVEKRPLATSAAWTVKPPAGPEIQAVPTVFAYQGWAVAMPGSQWIGPDANASAAFRPRGHYIYSYHFCLCGSPAGVGVMPATLSMKVLSDNWFTSSLNGTSIPNGVSQGNNPTFQQPTVVSNVPAALFQAGDNVLRIDVWNDVAMTGLDVVGTISGYFAYLPNASCPGQLPSARR